MSSLLTHLTSQVFGGEGWWLDLILIASKRSLTSNSR
jgi:hypothetical protein